MIAALDSQTATISFYEDTPSGFVWLNDAELTIPDSSPVSLVAGDLNNDGLDDLVVGGGNTSQVFIFVQNANGSFSMATGGPFEVGLAPVAITLANIAGHNNGLLDIAIADQGSGDVTVLINDNANFSTAVSPLRFRAGTELYGASNIIDPMGASTVVQSILETSSLVAGPFSGGATADLIVTNEATHNISLITGDGTGGFLSPLTLLSEDDPSIVIAGHFNSGPNLDLAVLDKQTDEIHIYLNEGNGNFKEVDSTIGNRTGPLLAGSDPTGLSFGQITVPGQPTLTALLVGNAFGDLLVYVSNGDGTFQPLSGESVSLVVTGPGNAITANEASSDVTSYVLAPGGNDFPAKHLCPVRQQRSAPSRQPRAGRRHH